MGRQRKCVVPGCHRSNDIAIKTFCIPRIRKKDEAITTRRQKLWLRRLKLSGMEQSINYKRVCEAHFLSGKPSDYLDEKNPDWAPSQNIGSVNFVSKSAYERYKRRKKFEIMRAETTEWLLKGKVIRQISHHPSGISNSSSTHASSHKNAFSSKEIDIVKKKITHQMPGVLKKLKKIPEVLKQDQLDLFWMYNPPFENSPQVCVGEIVLPEETHPSSAAQSSMSINGKEPGAPGKSVENGDNGVDPEQVVRSNRIFFISSNTTHDHDYCAKPIGSDSPQSALEHRCSPIDHDYCRTLSPHGSPSAVEEDSNSRHIPSQTDGSNQNSQEAVKIVDDEIVGLESDLESHPTIDIFCEFILPDVAINDNDSICNRCSEDVSKLQTVLEQKSTILEGRLKDLDSVKQELERAKEHINKLRAQLEENTNTLCSYFSVDGKPS